MRFFFEKGIISYTRGLLYVKLYVIIFEKLEEIIVCLDNIRLFVKIKKI